MTKSRTQKSTAKLQPNLDICDDISWNILTQPVSQIKLHTKLGHVKLTEQMKQQMMFPKKKQVRLGQIFYKMNDKEEYEITLELKGTVIEVMKQIAEAYKMIKREYVNLPDDVFFEGFSMDRSDKIYLNIGTGYFIPQ